MLAAMGVPALAQEDPLRDLGDPVARVQSHYAGISDEDRAELVLLPVLAEMEPLPDGVGDWVTPVDSSWGDVGAWLESDAQRAVIEAIGTVGEFDARMVWGLGYGKAHAHTDLAGNPLVPTLTNGAYLAGMSLAYLDSLQEATWLVHFEALRLASDGSGLEALQLEAAMLRTWRLIADRAMYDEVVVSFEQMTTLLEMMRDLMYLYPDSVTPDDLKEVIKELDDRALRIDRVRFPTGDQLAFQQIVRDSFHRFGQPDATSFGPLMAQLATGERALQLFGEADWWVRAADSHGDYFTTSDAIDAVFGDWEFRWNLDPFDPFHATQRTRRR
jgi:hypothetical protein